MVIITNEKIGVSKMCEKHNNGRNVSEVWKYTLNKIQRSNERLDKESIERQNDS